MNNMENKKQEELQQVVGELREAQQNVEILQSQSEELKNSINEIESTKETLEGIEEVEAGTELLVPLGSGSYLPVEAHKPDKVLMDLGADLVAERSPEKVSELIDKQKKDIEGSLEEIQNRIKKLNEKIEELRPKAQELIEEAQSGQQTESEQISDREG
ncbi:hypothetical protein AKJ51_02520 [candidate division MSBL1 archaeon SCGC-AAA382A20]|uniref:Prefoldin subunit alpha n=1 Tax=candidate division MSBL1 archaeon SCGC-AAA382A20 TaxID=1698280 RepID=A0A133VKH9_9EURY|nr:hypothetical protein AKJ51_02520 [candidate division MSBL1 archaeon SCGC-AAA382A20]